MGELLAKKNAEAECRFEMEKNGETTVLQEYGTLDECTLSVKDISFPMILRIRCRSKGDKSKKMYEICIDENIWD